MEENHQRIQLWMAGCIVAVAFTIDLVEMLLEWLGIGLVMTFAIAPAVTFLFWLWYKLLSVPFVASPKKFATLAITCLVEIIPGLDALVITSFGWTIGAIIMVVMVRLEDKGGIIGTLSGSAMGIMQKRYATYKGDFDRMGQLNQKQQNVLRRNMAISKNELVSEAGRRNFRFSQDQYTRATEVAADKLNNKYEKGDKG